MKNSSAVVKGMILLAVLVWVCGMCFGEVLRIEDFGGVGDGKTDCSGAFEKALAEAKKVGGEVTIQMGKGRYFVTTELPDGVGKGRDMSQIEGQDKEDAQLFKQVRKFEVSPCVEMVGLKGVTVAGVGMETEVIVGCPLANGFMVTGCDGIVFRDFAIDYEPLPFTQGRIVGVDVEKGTFDYRIDEGFDGMGEWWFENCDSKWGVPFGEDRLFSLGGESAVFSDRWQEAGERTWRMFLHWAGQGKGLKVGDRFVHLARMGGTSAIFFSKCGDVRVEDVEIYTNPGAGTIFYQCEGEIRVDGLRVRPRPGSGRIFSLNADGVHCQSCRRGPVIENCVFEGMADDGMNFYAAPSVIGEVIAGDKVRVNEVHVLRAGDRVQIVRPSDGTIMAEEVEVVGVEGNVVTLGEAVEGLLGGKNHLEGDTLFNLSASGSGFVVRNNVIGGFRGRGILARAHHGLIENNLIHDTSGQGIVVCNEPDWPEGPIPADVTIRGNTIVGVHRDKEQVAAIHVAAFRSRYGVAGEAGLKDIVIENNLILDSPRNGILLSCVTGAVVRGNVVQLTGNERGIGEYCGILLEKCEDVKIDGFSMVDQWGRVGAAVLMRDTEKEDVAIKGVNADLKVGGELIKQGD